MLFLHSFTQIYPLVNRGGNTRVSHVSTPSPRVKTQAPSKVGMDLANAKLVPTQEAPNIGTDVANARLMPTREATKVGTILANAKLMPTSEVETCVIFT